MSRPLRIELPGGLYHLTARTDEEALFPVTQDRLDWMELLKGVIHRYNWQCLAWCQLDRHYHLVVRLPKGRLSLGMRQLNGLYTQIYNRRHGRKGSLFSGRFKALLVDDRTHLLPLIREVVTEPWRKGWVSRPQNWPWGSAQALLGESLPEQHPPLHLEVLNKHPEVRGQGGHFWKDYLYRVKREPRIWEDVHGQIFLGHQEFARRTLKKLQQQSSSHLTRKLELADYQARYPEPECLVLAYLEGGYTLQQIAEYFAVHPSTVSRRVKAWEKQQGRLN